MFIKEKCLHSTRLYGRHPNIDVARLGTKAVLFSHKFSLLLMYWRLNFSFQFGSVCPIVFSRELHILCLQFDGVLPQRREMKRLRFLKRGPESNRGAVN